MSDEGEKTCPLCAEEMDLTDQQLKPCKCGYEICVWCWHHIMDMAEKDETEGRCPACRTPYNKEKIVGTAASCERLVAEINQEKKLKSQKGKNKADSRKQLSSVRVIQRNLVYIVGLPLNLADEDLLQRKEYFGQYGKVLKVSISRTASGAIQYFANNTCSVYITYSKEEEAVRCIQSVHGFTLDGRPLRACFGTTKYCHAWLRNVPCTNPDCLYLHEVGSQEDSFTKDEIISAYTRSRVQQITGATNSMQRRSGNVLPPPADEYCDNSTASSVKPVSKSATNNSAINIRSSPPNSSSGRSVALPAGASWGTRTSSNQPPYGSVPSSNGPLKQQTDTCNGSMAFSTAVLSPNEVSSLQNDLENKIVPDEECSRIQERGKMENLEPIKQNLGAYNRPVSETPALQVPPASPQINDAQCSLFASKEKDKRANVISDFANSFELSAKYSWTSSDDDSNDLSDSKIQKVCSDIQSMSLDRHQEVPQGYIEQFRESLTTKTAEKAMTSADEICISRRNSDMRLKIETKSMPAALSERQDTFQSFNDQGHKNPEVIADTSCFPNLPHSIDLMNQYRAYSPRLPIANGLDDVGVDLRTVDSKVTPFQASGISVVSNGYPESLANGSFGLGNSIKQSYVYSDEDNRNHTGRAEGEVVRIGDGDAVDMGESSIISNILSLDLDSWDESLTSPQNLVKLLGETDKKQGSLGVSGSWKIQQSNQSRFSFAREDEPVNQSLGVERSLSYIDQAFNGRPSNNHVPNDMNSRLDRFPTHSGFSLFANDEYDNFGSNNYQVSGNKLVVSRSQVSAPPGFSAPRAPPPGFTSHERFDQTLEMISGNYISDAPNLIRNQYQAAPAGNIVSNGDIEFIDPAILAVGKGRLPNGLNSGGLDLRSSFAPHVSAFENEARLQLLMQRSLSPHQGQRFTDIGDSYSPLGDAYGIPPRVVDQTMANNLSPFLQPTLPQSRNPMTSNGHWDGWSEAQGVTDFTMAELMANERLGYTKFYSGYDDAKFRMPSSSDLYNRTFGI